MLDDGRVVRDRSKWGASCAKDDSARIEDGAGDSMAAQQRVQHKSEPSDGRLARSRRGDRIVCPRSFGSSQLRAAKIKAAPPDLSRD